jgi:hypothetical protein
MAWDSSDDLFEIECYLAMVIHGPTTTNKPRHAHERTQRVMLDDTQLPPTPYPGATPSHWRSRNL